MHLSRVKGLLRKVEARSRNALIEALGVAISAVTAIDVRGFFQAVLALTRRRVNVLFAMLRDGKTYEERVPKAA